MSQPQIDPPEGTLRHWRLDIDADSIAWLAFDRHAAGTNTLSTETMTELGQVIADVQRRALLGLVVWSAKENGFIAGADINEFPKLDSEARAYDLIRHGQSVLEQIAGLPFPSVAVLNGFALGGGLELALACTGRIAFRGEEPVFGLPEIQLGVHPGFGGTVRATRLIGVRHAMDLILTGRSIRPREALALGLVDALVGPTDWRAAATGYLQKRHPVRPAPLLDRLLGLRPFRPLMARILTRRVAEKAAPEHYPAPGAVIDLWQHHGASVGPESFDAEARSFARLVVTPTSRNLVRVFFLQERLKKLVTDGTRLKHVHVIGAGIMGGDIAAWCALRGLRVTLQDREMKYIESALGRAARLFERKLRDPAALAAARSRLTADSAGAGAAEADLVIEAVFEDLEVKRSVYERLEPMLRPGAVIATNTSSIPLEVLGGCLRDPGRLIGLHFFNPVAKLPLVEVVAAPATAASATALGLGFARQIGKLPLPCRSHPGFLVNRILAPYIGEAMELLREGVPLAEIDHAAVEFGMPMGPIELTDSVGLDVARHVARVMAPVIGRPVAPEIEELVSRGHLGVKTGQGFYTYRDRRPVRPALGPGSARPEVQDRLILALLNEAAACLGEEIVADADLVDAGVVFGTGFAPFRGGPLQHARAVGVDGIVARLEDLAAVHGPRFRPSPGWQRVRN